MRHAGLPVSAMPRRKNGGFERGETFVAQSRRFTPFCLQQPSICQTNMRRWFLRSGSTVYLGTHPGASLAAFG